MLTPPPAWVLDLDGVIWLGDTPIDGAAAACSMLVACNRAPLFVTNMSRYTVEQQEAKLERHGIDASGRVITSALAAAELCEPGDRAVVVGGPGIVAALEARNVEVVPEGPADVVVVGMDPAFDYALLKRGALAVRGGARLIGTNADPTYPTTEGLLPGAGALLAAMEVATGTAAQIGGKPGGAVVGLLRRRLGDDGIVVGDRPDTDGAFAAALGYEFGLVFSGVTAPTDLPCEPAPTRTAPDLLSLVSDALGAP